MKNKMLLWLDIFSAHFGMAKLLQEEEGYEIFSIIDVNEGREFYEEQNLVKFSKKWYYRDCFDSRQKKPNLQYLEEIEKKYRFNIWKIIYSDINFYKYNEYHKFSYDEILIIIEQECRFFEKVLDEVEPDFLAIRITDLSNAQILQKICIGKEIKVLMLGFTRFGNRAYISHEYDYLDVEKQLDEKQLDEKQLDEKQLDEKQKKSFEELREYVQSIASLQSLFRKEFRNSRKKWISGALKYLILVSGNKYKKYYANKGKNIFKVLFVEGIFPLKTKYRKKFIDKNLSKKIEHNQKFIYYALQLEPERSTLVPATFYTNQLNVITNVAKSIPIDFQLYVKEHPMQKIRGWRNTSFYKQIIELPNVKLIHPSISNEEMLEKCKMVITIAGTTGLEAALYKKPCIVFADVIYSSLPSVHRLKSLEELPTAIRESLKKEVKLSDVNELINVLDRNSFEFDIFGYYSKISKNFINGGFMIKNKISMNYLNSFIEEDREIFEMLAEEHIKKINEIKKCED